MWDVSTQAEVYSLTVLLFSMLVYLVLVQWKRKDTWPLLLTAYLYGLSFGNHMMAVLLLPSFLLATVPKWRELPVHRGALLLWLLLFFAAGASLYVYLPLRSFLAPPLDWGKPHTLERFLAHVSGWQYRVWMFSGSAGALAEKLAAFPGRLTREFTLPGTLLVAAGIAGMAWKRAEGFSFLAVLFAAGMFYALNYDIPDIDPYYLPACLSLSLMAGLGLVHLAEALPRRVGQRPRTAIVLAFAILAAASLARNVRETDKSGNRLALHYGRNFLRSLEPGSLALTKSWDIYSPIIYLQQVEGLRPDVIMIDFELMRRSWYVEQLMEQPIAHSEKTRRAMKEFSAAVRPFERGEPFDAARLDALFKAMLDSILQDALARGSACIDFADEPDLARSRLRVPHLMSYALVEDPMVPVPGYDTLDLEGARDPAVPKDERTRAILDRYWIFAINRGIFLAERRECESALEALEFGLALAPENIAGQKALAYCLESLGRREEALRAVETILKLAPADVWAKAARARLE
jgi:tetratricopeptide (TPR) repeat protein